MSITEDGAPERISGSFSRRHVMGLAGAAMVAPLIACASAGPEPRAHSKGVAAMDVSSPQRVWAKNNLRGLLNLFLPTFLPDQQTLDEEALRHDVRHAIAQGFSGTLPMVNWTLPLDPRWEQFQRIVIDEAKGRLPVHGAVFNSDPDADIALIKRLEALGVEMILITSRHDPGISAEDLYTAMYRRITSTNLPVMLYAALGRGRSFAHLGPAGQPLDVFDRLADLPNVTSVKISQPVTLISTMQICERVADRLLVAPVNLDFVPLLSRHYPIQWSGQWNAEAVQTPEHPLGNELIAACVAGDEKRVSEIALRIQPVVDHFYKVQAGVIARGAHPWQHNKYYSWLGGGNGGLLPTDPHAPEGVVPVLDAISRRQIREAFAASGLNMTDAPEEQFIVGRAAWARGIRASSMTASPNYEA